VSAPSGVYVHPSALLDEPAQVGEGTRIWHFSHIMAGAVLGRGCNLGQNVFVAGSVRLGNNVKVQNNVSIYDGVVCEDDVFLGPSCVFTNVRTPRSHVNRRGEYTTTLVKRGASVGANATIVCGVTVGEFALIGAGAVVTSDVAPHALMLGVPARRKGWACWCGAVLPDAEQGGTCGECGRSYHRPDAQRPITETTTSQP